jgi:peptidoglycan/LPS O-acetylase OafA/YrhL
MSENEGSEMATTDPAQVYPAVNHASKGARLHYLDWLQVIAILGVFLFHAVHPFDDLYPWHIKNEEPSLLVNFFVGFFGAWGMPFFFLMAGATSWFSLRHRSAGRYLQERVTRLLIPFLVGSFFLTPIQAYFELTHKEWWPADSFLSFLFSPAARTFFFTTVHPLRANSTIFGALGYHLWFVGFLFAYSIIGLPFFLWIKDKSAATFGSFVGRMLRWRGGSLLFFIPPTIARLLLQPYFPGEHEWADFAFMLLFFISGFLLIRDDGFSQSLRRDWPLHLILGIASTLFFFSSAAGVPLFEWLGAPGTLAFYLSWTVVGINSWCWTMFVFYIGIRYLRITNRWLQYGREASYPFFFLHQPVIIIIAFFVVQWRVILWAKLMVVVLGSFLFTLGAYELFVRRVNPVRRLFGMKARISGA